MAGQDAVKPGGDERAEARTVRRGALGWLAGHWKSLVHWVVVLAAFGYLVWQAPVLISALAQTGEPLSSLKWGWVALAAGCSLTSLALYGEMQRQVLSVGGVRMRPRTMQSIIFAENAISDTIPVVGVPGSVAFAISRMRRLGVDVTLASWAVLLPGVVSPVTLIILALIIGAVVGWLPVAAAVALVALAIGAAIGFWLLATRPVVLRAVLQALLHLGRRMPFLCRSCRSAWQTDPGAVADRVSSRIGLLRPTPVQWTLLIGLATLSWVFDFLAVNVVAAAVGLPPRWDVFALGFLVVQASIALQVMPNGAGLAEAGLLGVLLAAGLPAAPAAAMVVVYRMIAWLGLSLLGWLVYAAQIHHRPRDHSHSPEVPVHAHGR